MLTRSLAWVATLLLAAVTAAGQTAPAPQLPDPRQTAPNLPYCP